MRTGLQGRELEELNRAMGIGVNEPKAPGVDEAGQFTLHTVRPGDMAKLRLVRPTTQAIGLRGADLEELNRAMGIGGGPTFVQGRQADGSFQIFLRTTIYWNV